MRTTIPTTSAESRSPNKTRYKIQHICPTCIAYSEEFMRFFKDESKIRESKDGKKYHVYKQVNKLKTGKKSLEEFEITKEYFVRHFNDCHVSNNHI